MRSEDADRNGPPTIWPPFTLVVAAVCVNAHTPGPQLSRTGLALHSTNVLLPLNDEG